jgi:hypothetical protein
LTFLHEAEQQVLGPYVVVAELPRLLDAELQDALGLRRERHLPERQGFGEARQRPLDLRLHRLQPQPQPLEDGGRDAFPVPDQPEEDMLGTNEIVAETPRLFTRKDDHPTCPFGEPFKHRSPPHPFSVPFTREFPLADG